MRESADPRNAKDIIYQHAPSGRELNAWLGLVPRQHSSGGRSVLLGISKRDDRYSRTLLIHGARAALRFAARKRDPAAVGSEQ